MDMLHNKLLIFAVAMIMFCISDVSTMMILFVCWLISIVM